MYIYYFNYIYTYTQLKKNLAFYLLRKCLAGADMK